MNAKRFALFLAAGALAAAVRAQGPLVPSAAPGPTMKSLAQIEPRTAITNVPYTISQPGSYYLATNLNSGSTGITIGTNGVTLDLMGFTLSGDRSGLGHGIHLSAPGDAPVRDVVVRNGSIRGFSYGVQAKNSRNGRFEELAVFSNLYYGIKLDGVGGACDGNAIVRCALRGNGYAAIHLDGSGGQCNGNRVVDCVVAANADDGLGLYAASAGRCNGNLVSGCTFQGNGDHGILVQSGTGQCHGNAIVRCIVVGNTSYGINVAGSSGQCNGNLIAGCTAVSNGTYGILLNGNGGRCAGNVVRDCMVGENNGTGIRLNVAAGNRVQNNRIYDFAGGTKYGLDCVSSTNNLLVLNSSGGQTFDYLMGVRDVYGPIVTNVGELATSGASAHPWANFDR